MRTKLLALVAGVLLAAAPTALADHGQTAPQKARGVAYVVSGTVAAVDADAGTLTVTVERTNRHARSFKGHDAVFTLASAHVRGPAAAAGDRVDVLAKLPRGTEWSEDGAYPAKRVVVHHARTDGHR